jgi:signal transduction histidine kinase
MADEKIHAYKENPELYTTNEVIEVMGTSYFKVIKTDSGTVMKSIDVVGKDPHIEPQFLKQIVQEGRFFKTIEDQISKIRMLYAAVDDENIMQFSLPLDEEEELLSLTRNVYLVVLAISPVLSFFVGWILSDRTVKPVIDFTRKAQDISHSNPKTRLKIQSSDIELSNLSLVFNSIMDRYERFMENQRQFTADMSHEIRSPLTAIKGNIEVTMRRQRTPEEYEEILQSNLEEINRIISILNNLLFLSKVDTGGVELNLHEFNLGRLLDRVIVNKKHLISEKHIDIKTEWEDILFYGDEVLLGQLCTNLLDNALHYTPDNGRITICVSRVEKGLNVYFQDTGVGIPVNETKKIFNRFYRIRNNLNMHETGSGLGLYLCRWIAEAHGGKITLTSEVNRGSTFFVFLPFQDDSHQLLD